MGRGQGRGRGGGRGGKGRASRGRGGRGGRGGNPAPAPPSAEALLLKVVGSQSFFSKISECPCEVVTPPTGDAATSTAELHMVRAPHFLFAPAAIAPVVHYQDVALQT